MHFKAKRIFNDFDSVNKVKDVQNLVISIFASVMYRRPLHIIVDKGSSKKRSVSQTKTPTELGLFAMCSEAQNMIPHNARKNMFFFSQFCSNFFGKNSFKHDMENFKPSSLIRHAKNC